jgi:Zn-dependent protease
VNVSRRELRDLVAAWLLLGLAFALFRVPVSPTRMTDVLGSRFFANEFVLSLATVGVAFLLHELAHKVVAVRFGQDAEFRADYGMLGLAVAGGLAGFLFAAPGAVHHRGYITPKENGLIALAGPLTNVALAAASFALLPVAPDIGSRGLFINVLLAGFNMIPFGPLDGATVLEWSPVAYALSAVVTVGPAVVWFLGVPL